MNNKMLTCMICSSVLALFFTMNINKCFAESNEELQSRVKLLEEENQKLKHRVKFSEAVVPRGTDANRTNRTIAVSIPENASNLKIEAFMKNEPWGGHHNPPKPNTDDLGSSHYMGCPLGTGECAISWSKVSAPLTTTLDNGRTQISAVFTNWAHRNDRTGKLQVTYQVD